MLRFLVGAACVVIIAGGGYYGFSEYSRHVERQDAEARALLRAQIDMCKLMHRQLDTNQITEDWRVLHVVDCLEEGHLTDADFSAAHMSGILDQARSLMKSAELN